MKEKEDGLKKNILIVTVKTTHTVVTIFKGSASFFNIRHTVKRGERTLERVIVLREDIVV